MPYDTNEMITDLTSNDSIEVTRQNVDIFMDLINMYWQLPHTNMFVLYFILRTKEKKCSTNTNTSF